MLCLAFRCLAENPAGSVPSTFTFSFGGFLGESHRLILTNGSRCIYLNNPHTFTGSRGTTTNEVLLSKSEWVAFRKELDDLNVWSWNDEYRDPEICDGTVWDFEIIYSDKSLKSRGSNKYPDGFDKLIRAIQNLTGKSVK